MNPFSPAQIAGYVSFVLGLTAAFQRSDRRLKLFNSSQSFIYSIHYLLLGNLPAAASALVSSSRSAAALRYSSPLLACLFASINLAVGFFFAKSPLGWLTPIASATATLALFLLRGVRMRIVLLATTLCWLANGILTRSIGGTILETCTAAMSTFTILRLLREPSSEPLERAG